MEGDKVSLDGEGVIFMKRGKKAFLGFLKLVFCMTVYRSLKISQVARTKKKKINHQNIKITEKKGKKKESLLYWTIFEVFEKCASWFWCGWGDAFVIH